MQFLGAVERRVNRFIRAKRRLIEVLSEQKQAIITHALTRGLNPAIPLPPSGIGGSPAHWDSMSFGRCIRSVDQGWSPVAAEGELAEDQWAVLTLSCMRKGAFRPQAIKPIPLGANIPVSMTVSDGDLLMSRSNTRQLVGDCCIVKGARPRTILCDLIYRVRLNTSILHPRFALYWLLSPVARQQIEVDARGSSSTMVKISHSHIKRWRIDVPDLATQSAIVQFLDAEIEPIEGAIERVLREIDLISEFRTRLIADVVTGKLDVREAAARLPADTEGSEAIKGAEELLDDPEMFDEEDLDEAALETGA